MSTPIEALPGKVVLAFPELAEKIGSIIIAERSRRRVEFGKLVSIGDATNDEDEIRRRAIIEADKRGRLFSIPIAAGSYLYQLELNRNGEENTEGLTYDWLKNVRVFAISQLHTTVADPGNLTFPTWEK